MQLKSRHKSFNKSDPVTLAEPFVIAQILSHIISDKVWNEVLQCFLNRRLHWTADSNLWMLPELRICIIV